MGQDLTTLHQRMDARAGGLFECLPPMIETQPASQRPDWGRLPCGGLLLDTATFAMASSRTAKHGVRRSCAGVDGY